MKKGILIVISIFMSVAVWASLQTSPPVLEAPAANYERGTITGFTTQDVYQLNQMPDTWQVKSLSFQRPTGNLQDLQGGIEQAADVPEPAVTAVVLAAACALLVGLRKLTVTRQ